MKGLQDAGNGFYRAPDWETFVDACSADCEAFFSYDGTDYFVTDIRGAGHDGWFVALAEPFRKDFSYAPVAKDCDTFDELADQPVFPDGSTLRERFPELDMW